MSIEMRRPDGQIVRVAMPIECKEYHTEVGEDGIIESIVCVSRAVRPECKMCSLINAVKPKGENIDSKD